MGPGDVLAGKYRVEKTIGEGGMGVVLLATHLALDQPVALKYLRPALAGEPDMAARFIREARNAVRLTSEHVARVFDVGTLESGSPYMVMEYLEGQDLGQVLDDNGAMTIAAAVDAILQAIDAIAEAHDLGIVHRDLKPQNLFLTRRGGRTGFVKVLDFGISKAIDKNEERPLTKTSALLGSPAYMAPEQMRSARTVDGRADIWALGIILYELLTGRVPFYSASLPEQCVMITQDPLPPILEKRSDIPAGLAKLIEKCLEKDPKDRFANVRELATVLEPFRNAPGAAPSPTTRPQGSRFHPAPKVLRLKLDSTQPAASKTIEAAPIDPAALAPSPVPTFAQTTGAGVERVEQPIDAPRPSNGPRALALGAAIAVVAVVSIAIFVVPTRPSPHPAPAAPVVASEAPIVEPSAAPIVEPTATTPEPTAEIASAAPAPSVTAAPPLLKPKPAAKAAVVDAGVRPASEHRTTW